MIDRIGMLSVFGAIGLILLFCLYGLFVYAPVDLWTGRQCLALGYREARVSVILERYCVYRRDQTDVVVPLERAKREPLT